MTTAVTPTKKIQIIKKGVVVLFLTEDGYTRWKNSGGLDSPTTRMRIIAPVGSTFHVSGFDIIIDGNTGEHLQYAYRLYDTPQYHLDLPMPYWGWAVHESNYIAIE